MKTSKELDLRIIQYLRLMRFKGAWRQHRSAITFSVPPVPSGARSFTIFTAADSTYLRKFLRPFALSALAHIAKPYIHIHLYNPQKTDIELIENLRKEMHDAELSWSQESFSPEVRERFSSSSGQRSLMEKSLYLHVAVHSRGRIPEENRCGAAHHRYRHSIQRRCGQALQRGNRCLSAAAAGGTQHLQADARWSGLRLRESPRPHLPCLRGARKCPLFEGWFLLGLPLRSAGAIQSVQGHAGENARGAFQSAHGT